MVSFFFFLDHQVFDDLSGLCVFFYLMLFFFLVNLLLGRRPRYKVEALQKQEAEKTKKVVDEEEDNWEVPDVLPY